jgi:hypothetical protein
MKIKAIYVWKIARNHFGKISTVLESSFSNFLGLCFAAYVGIQVDKTSEQDLASTRVSI